MCSINFSDLSKDLSVVKHLIFPNRKGASEEERLENFYASQAEDYDRFRERLLPGREELIQKLIPENFNGVWCDFGAGTGRNLEYALPRLGPDAKVFLIDLCPSLLALARKRVEKLDLKNVEVIEGDVCTFDLKDRAADKISFSYSLTMIPPWRDALINAARLLTEGGEIGVVDFIDRPESNSNSDTLSARFWRTWFATDSVHLNQNHLLELERKFRKRDLVQRRYPLPIVSFLKPWRYIYIGQKTA